MKTLISLFLVISVVVVLYFQGSDDNQAQSTEQISAPTQPNVVFDISVQSVEQLREVLNRAEALASVPRSAAW